jgi:multidrug resistance efflux pump
MTSPVAMRSALQQALEIVKGKHMKPEKRTLQNPSANDVQTGAPDRKLEFRSESMQRHSNRAFGDTSLAIPLPFAWYSTAALSLAAMIIAFMAFGSYTTTEVTEAVIQTQSGVLDVRGEGEGIIAKLHVREGERVRKGQPLADLRRIEKEEISSEESATSDDTDADAETEQGNDESRPATPDEDRIADRSEVTPDPPQEDSVGRRSSGKAESKPNDVITIKSPMDAIVYQLPLDVGNNYNPYSNVVKLAADGDLIVTTRVFAETHGLLRVGDRIELRLKAFKGTPDARILGQVSSTAMTPSEDWNPQTRTTLMKYRVVIAIDLASTKYPADALLGRQVEIRVPVRKRRVYQWLFDPLKTLFGND